MGGIGGLNEIADLFDVAVLDQWGVLHDGTTPYPHAAAALLALRSAGKGIAVLSNSGRRADANRARIAACGLPVETIDVVVTSGDALWHDVESGRLGLARPFAIEAAPGDARRWAEGLPVSIAPRVEEADALLVMGLRDDATTADHEGELTVALARDLPLVCSNPDHLSPRHDGAPLAQPGALAAAYAARGGRTSWYGKPHAPIFEAVARVFPGVPPERFVMVGDSPEHDIRGGRAARWRTVLVRGGLHAANLLDGDDPAVAAVCARHGAPFPDHHMRWLAP